MLLPIYEYRKALKLGKGLHRKQMQEATALSKVDPQLAQAMVQMGNGETDRVSIGQKSGIKASRLLPSQRTMRIKHAVGIALGMLKSKKIGGGIGAIISKDGHIMDGHHRWAASILAAGEQATVGGWVANLEGRKLVAVLNVITKGYFGKRNGNKGTGDIKKFTPQETKKVLLEYTTQGRGGAYAMSAEEIQDILIDYFGSVEIGISTMSSNASYITTSVPSWAPDRIDMPVIDSNEVPEAAKLLNKGLVDWNEPFTQ
jgi:hypothetical protein